MFLSYYDTHLAHVPETVIAIWRACHGKVGSEIAPSIGKKKCQSPGNHFWYMKKMFKSFQSAWLRVLLELEATSRVEQAPNCVYTTYLPWLSAVYTCTQKSNITLYVTYNHIMYKIYINICCSVNIYLKYHHPLLSSTTSNLKQLHVATQNLFLWLPGSCWS